MRGRRKDINLIGDTYYELFVKGEGVKPNGKSAWLCECSCGKECLYTTHELLTCKRKSCGHLRGQSRTLDLTGQTFYDLTVRYKTQNKGNGKSVNGNIVGKTFWHCVCSCGKECDVQTSDLTSGKRKDCGHSHDSYMHEVRTADITGNVYGYLKVDQMLPSIKTGNKWRAMCKCKCLLCGNTIEVQRDYIVSGDTKSCGCLKSVGEQTILQYLINHNIPHKTQYSFSDLKTPKNGPCLFDFGILNDDKSLKFLIEYQGKQHYETMPGAWNFGEYERRVTDPLKRSYCLDHNIPLYEIKYDSDIQKELDKIFAC